MLVPVIFTVMLAAQSYAQNNSTIPPPSTSIAAPPPQSTNASTGGSTSTKTAVSTAQSITENLNKSVPLGGQCEQDWNCANDHAICTESPYNEDSLRCACDTGYHKLNFNATLSKCFQIIYGSTQPNCKPCEANGGTCLSDPSKITGYSCSCPSSQSGENCETLHVNVTCQSNQMTVCYRPHPNVNFSTGWTMQTRDTDDPRCVGQRNSTGCSEDTHGLSLSLAKDDLETCNTLNSSSPKNNQFYNTIVIDPHNETVSSYVFNVFCSFQSFAQGLYSGLGLVEPNGNDRGVQVNAKLNLNVVTVFNRTIPQGSTIIVGDKIKFRIGMARDGNYKTLQVIRCTASSSYMMPDSYAETRALMSNGCPIADEATASSWYWTVSQTTSVYYEMETGSVPMFKLSSTDVVYVHCSIKLCLDSYEDLCTPLNKTACHQSRRKREAVGTSTKKLKRAALVPTSDPQNVTTYLQVVSSKTGGNGNTLSTASGGSSPIVMGVIFSVLIAVVLVCAVAGTVLYINRRKQRQTNPGIFALSRLRNTHQRF